MEYDTDFSGTEIWYKVRALLYSVKETGGTGFWYHRFLDSVSRA